MRRRPATGCGVIDSLVVLAAGDARVEVDLADGARVASWRVADLELVGARDPGPVGHGMFLMAPWPGRVRGNEVRHDGVPHPLAPNFEGWAIHGTVLDRPADIVEATSSCVETVTPLGPGWPWPGQVRHSWCLSTTALRTEIAVESTQAVFPAEVGWHPWFRRRLGRGDDVLVDLAADAVLERGADQLPTGKVVEPDQPGPFDDAFHVPTGGASLTWPGALTLAVASDCEWFVLFDELADWVCLEPQSAPPDGLTGGFLVRPGRPRTSAATWRWSLA
jgi:aldose 1-epimerase